MPTDLPTPSISGQHDWEWNRLQAQQDSQDASTPPANRTDEHPRPEHQCARRGSTGPRRSSSDSRCAPKDVSRRELAAALERRERRLQHVIDHYEHLLAEKNRQLADQDETSAAARIQQTLSSFFEFLVR